MLRKVHILNLFCFILRIGVVLTSTFVMRTNEMKKEKNVQQWLALKVKVKVKSLSRVRLFATPWTNVAHQAPPSMGFSRQEYWGGLPFPSLELLNKQQ